MTLYPCSVPAKTFQGGINVTPSTNHNSNSPESSDDEEFFVNLNHDDSDLNSSRQALDMEEGGQQRHRRSESVLSRLNRYAGSFRVRLAKKDQRRVDQLESDER